MRSTFRRIAVVSAVVVSTGLAGGTAFGLGPELSRDYAGAPTTGAGDGTARVNRLVVVASDAAQNAGDAALGLGGVRPGPLPGPTPVVHPEEIVNAAIQKVGTAIEKVGRGLGGVGVGPIPAPTPVVQPDPDGRNTQIVNRAIQTVATTVEDVGRGLGGVGVGPIPAPTPIVTPEPEVS